MKEKNLHQIFPPSYAIESTFFQLICHLKNILLSAKLAKYLPDPQLLGLHPALNLIEVTVDFIHVGFIDSLQTNCDQM